MLGISFGELVIIATISLFILGPKDTVVLLKKLGAFLSNLKKKWQKYLDHLFHYYDESNENPNGATQSTQNHNDNCKVHLSQKDSEK